MTTVKKFAGIIPRLPDQMTAKLSIFWLRFTRVTNSIQMVGSWLGTWIPLMLVILCLWTVRSSKLTTSKMENSTCKKKDLNFQHFSLKKNPKNFFLKFRNFFKENSQKKFFFNYFSSIRQERITREYEQLSFIAGGTGITPFYQVTQLH